MDMIINLLFFPWKSLDATGVYICISVGLAFAVLLIILILSSNRKIRYLYYKCYFTYLLVFSCNLMFLFSFLWYAALPITIIVTIQTYCSTQKELEKIRKEELEGGWCCNFNSRKQQIEDFKFKLDEVRETHREYCISHPIVLNPKIIILFSFMLPIAITLILWLCGAGYRWYGYPLVESIE